MIKKTLLIIIICIFFIFKFIKAYPQISFLTSIKTNNYIKSNKNILKSKKKKFFKKIIIYNSINQNHNLIKKKSFLIGNASIKCSDINILADYIEIDWKSNMIYARGKINYFSGKIIKPAIFIEKKNKYEYDNLRLNFKTKKGYAENIRIEKNNSVIISKKLFLKNNFISIMFDNIYTTDTYFKQKKN